MQSNPTIQRAKSLRSGDKVSLITPSSPFQAQHFKFAEQWLQGRGYKVGFQKNTFAQQGYLAGSDARRKSEFEKAMKSNANAVFCTRGGYGATRLFQNGLDVERLKKNPKLFMGLSDITVLLNYVSSVCNLVTVHGPVLAGQFFSEMAEKKRKRAFDLLEKPIEQELKIGKDFQSIFPGTAKGRLWGGNLCLVLSSFGTSFQIPSGPGNILFLEEVAEAPYRVDRMVTQLYLSGFLSRFEAILLGDFTDTKGKVFSKAWLKNLFQPFMKKKVPLICGLASSHVRMDVLLPIGGEVEVHPKKIILSPLVS